MGIQRVPNLLRWTVLACCLPYPGDPKSAIDCFFLFGISLHPGVTGSAPHWKFRGCRVHSFPSPQELLRPASWLALLSRTFTFELAPTRSPSISVEYDYVDKQSIPTAGLSPASPTALWAAGHQISPWVREVRKLTPSGHQVSLISTAYGELALQDAAQLFSRWSQENFLRYMMQHYAIDLLNEYRTEEIPETKRPVVNPQWRELDRQRRSVKSKLTHHQARFAALTLHPQSDEAAQSKWEKRKAELVEAIEQFDHELTGINSQLKTTPSHLDWDKLPETEKFQRLAPSRKQLVDTVRLIAYRGETALAAIVREELARTDDARSLLRDLFCSEADLLPDLEQRVLRVQVHPMSNPRANRAIAHLLEHLNAAQFTYPGTKLQLVYSIAGEAETPNSVPQQNPTDQEV